MSHTLVVEAIIDGFMYPTFPKKLRKPEYTSIQYTYRILTVHAASIKSPCRGVQNDHIGIVLIETQ